MCVFAAVTWPLSETVAEVTEVLEGGELDALIGLMDEAMRGCAEVRDDLAGPWMAGSQPFEGDHPVCAGLPQRRR